MASGWSRTGSSLPGITGELYGPHPRLHARGADRVLLRSTLPGFFGPPGIRTTTRIRAQNAGTVICDGLRVETLPYPLHAQTHSDTIRAEEADGIARQSTPG